MNELKENFYYVRNAEGIEKAYINNAFKTLYEAFCFGTKRFNTFVIGLCSSNKNKNIIDLFIYNSDNKYYDF